MNLREIAVLRTKLRELNIEYSALVRSKTGEGRFVRMGELQGGTAGTDGADRRGPGSGCQITWTLQPGRRVVVGGRE